MTLEKRQGRKENSMNFDTKLQVGQGQKIVQKWVPSPSSTNGAVKRQKNRTMGPVTTTTFQSIDYITVKAIESVISKNRLEWPEWALKELMDNAYDWLNTHYPYPYWDKDARIISVHIKTEPIPSRQNMVMLRIAVRNSNVNNIPVFQSIEGIFDFKKWVSEKRNQYMIMCGGLGDFLKRALGMGYALWTDDLDDDSFEEAEDMQWPEPVIIRYNRQQRKVFITVDRDVGSYWSVTTEPVEYEAPDFTEQEIALPIPTWHYERHLDKSCQQQSIIDNLKEYYLDYKLAKFGVDSRFSKEELTV